MTSAVLVWNPTTSTKIAITDITVAAAAGGTIQIRFGNIGGDIIEELMVAGSMTVGRSYELPALSTTFDRAVFAESGMNGFVSVSLKGLEES